MTPATLLLAAVLAADPGPLAIDVANVDRGEINANKPLAQTFRLRNTGTVPLSILDVVGVCGCARTRVADPVLGPGKETELAVGINLLTQPEGPGSWKLAVRYRVESDPPLTGERVVQIAATVKKDVSVEPVALMLLSEKDITGALTVRDRRGKPLTVTGARVGLKGVRTEVKPAADADGRRTQRVEVAVGDGCPPGQYADEVCIDTDDPEYRELRIPLRVVRKAPATGVQAAPASGALRFAREQATATALVRLRDADDREVVVEKVECDHPAVACKWAAGPGAMSTVRVTVDRERGRGVAVAIVTVRLKGPVAETVVIPVTWTLPESR